MPHLQTPFERKIALGLNQLIDRRGFTRRELARRLGRRADYVSRRLRGAGPITIAFLEECLDHLSFTPSEFLDGLFLTHSHYLADRGVDTIDSLAVTIDSYLTGVPLTDSRLQPFLQPSWNTQDSPAKFPAAQIREYEEVFYWESRQTTLNNLYFWLEEKRTLRDPIAYAAALACLAANIRFGYPGANTDALHLLRKSADIAVSLGSSPLAAYVMDKAARTFWDSNHKAWTKAIYASPELLHHPLLDSYFTVRGIYAFYDGDFRLAAGSFRTAWRLCETTIAKACLLDNKALLVARSNPREGHALLREALDQPRIPDRLRQHLLLSKARIFSSDNQKPRAQRLLASLIRESTNPELRAYAAAEFYDTEPSHELAIALDPVIAQVCAAIDPPPNLPMRATLNQIQAARQNYSGAETSVNLRRRLVPGS